MTKDRVAALKIVVLCTLGGCMAACTGLLPRAGNESFYFESFEQAQNAIESLVPMQSNEGDLAARNLDPDQQPNTAILSFADISKKFLGGGVLSRDDLGPGVTTWTEEGRAASSQNALTHGAYAAEPSGRVEYECHREEVRAYLCPLGKVETVLVDQIAHEMWRVMSLNSHEMQATMIMEGADPDLRGLARKLDFPYGEKLHHMLAERVNESALRRRMRAFWLACVDDLQDPDSSDDDTTRYVDRLEGLRALSIEVLAFLESRLSDPEQWELVTKSLDRLESQVKARVHPLHDIFASDRGLTFWAEFWVMRNQLRISEAKYLMIHSRVIEFLSFPNLVRARLHTETTLAKQIDRLRAMQESRRSRRAS